MLSNIIKVAALGLVGIGAKKLYEQFKNEEKALSLATVTKDLDLDPSINLRDFYFEKEEYVLKDAEKITDPMMKLIRLATTDSFDQAHFYNHLKSHLPEAAQNWNDEQKNEFVRAVLSTFEGAFRWDYYHAEHHANILDMCNAKGTMRDCLRFVAELFPDVEQGKRLALILKEVARIQNRLKNPIYDKNQTPSVQFKDIRFKFAIIQQLMAKEQLKPVFNYQLFVEEFSYFIDPGFPSSAAGDYMLNLDITQHQLNCVSDLYLNHYSGDFSFLHLPRQITGESSLYEPFDLRCRPADIVPMTTNVIEDLALLPNLKYIYLPKDKPFEILEISQMGLMKFSDGKYFGAGLGIKIDNLILPRVFLEALNERKITVFHGSEKLDIAAILNGESA
ncbi:DUF6892 domain-containing protein [Actinobacillus porcinus]|uniref:DUF6892 domain-containing protein n=1 Tax=Actinobacillus porcinus TaxID=51048 RepID=UPI002357EDBA|nr:hypothetical protein [Actinobacillus porcinus]MCI5763612.1 hypothetical protein [Actinobacillus porcinus]MDD7546101.1 hypothetical protein [Actinobacillus porcinus]MDY5421548.1 hypothetical protein [Actinobacillus porcinus]MDY5849132.1 hypothetical protein [Actinobacillus porcinus]